MDFFKMLSELKVNDELIVMLTTPIYTIIIGLEIALSAWGHRHFYSIKETITNVYLTSLNMGLDLAVRFVLTLPVLNFFYQYHFMKIETTWLYWFALFIAEDFVYYWLHRMDHHTRFFWAVHVTHHSSEEYNLTTGFRSSVFQPLYRFIYFIPLSLFGFQAADIFIMYSITQIYGILVHTQMVEKLGFLEHLLITPSHHRVHHASNVPYLDKNLGMCLLIWDKIFGTFEPENIEKHGPTVYGLTKELDERGPVNIVLHEWIALWKGVVFNKNIPLSLKWKYISNPPGWSHDGSMQTSVELQHEYNKQFENK